MAATTRTNLFELLDREWRQLSVRPATTKAVRRWGSEEAALARFGSLEQLVAHVECRQTDRASREEVLSALAARASTDELAARLVLQLVLPALKALLHRFFSPADGEWAADVVTTVYGRIRTFEAEPRPTWVARRLFECARMRLRTLVRQDRRRASHELTRIEPGWTRLMSEKQFLGTTLAETVPERSGADERSAAEELAELLDRATASGQLGDADAEVIRLYRLDHVCDADAAARYGGVAANHQRRRQRAEGRLRAVAAGAA
jgi:hypothetical protein